MSDREQPFSDVIASLDKNIRIQSAIVKGRQALIDKNWLVAHALFEDALNLDEQNLEAHTGLREALFRAGNEAEERQRLGEARQYYRALLSWFQEDDFAGVRLKAVTLKIRLRWAIAIAIGLVILVCTVFWISHLITLQ